MTGLGDTLIETALVTKVSGAAHLEKSTMGERPGYKEYVERTSGFFPRCYRT